METEEKSEVAPLTTEEAQLLTIEASALLDDVEDVGLRLMAFVEGDEQTKLMLPQIKMIASMAFLANSEFVMTCYDRYGIRVEKSRHCDVPVSPPTGYTQALEVADVMVDRLRKVERPFELLFGAPLKAIGTNDAMISKAHYAEVSKKIYMALEFALSVRGALLLITSGFDFTAMNATLGFKANPESTPRFGL